MTERIDKAEALISAPQESIYQAFIKEEAFRTWLTPDDMTNEVEAFNPVEGGNFIIRLEYDDEAAAGKSGGNTDRYTGTFTALEPYNRVVFTVEFDTFDDKYEGVMEQEWVMIGQGDATEVIVSCRNVPEGIDQNVHERALIVALYRLAEYLGADVR